MCVAELIKRNVSIDSNDTIMVVFGVFLVS